MTAIDATGIAALEALADTVHTSGRGLILCGAREQPSQLMRQAEFEDPVGHENICASITEALERAKLLLPLVQAAHPAAWGRRSTDSAVIPSENLARQ